MSNDVASPIGMVQGGAFEKFKKGRFFGVSVLLILTVFFWALFVISLVFYVLYLSAYSRETRDSKLWDFGLSAAARSFDTTLSISSPIYPASVSEVASLIARGTSRSLARVLTR